jgi:ADP-dependent NAD(P)H-hydrate dehydratase
MKPLRVTDALLRKWPLPDAEMFHGKEERGRVLIIGGSTRVPGAAMLAATASLRAGAGKLHVATSRQAAMALAIAMPEAMVSGLPSDARGDIASLGRQIPAAAEDADAVLVGPGMDATPATRRVAAVVLRRAKAVVLDAGALHAATAVRMGACVLTPHAGEMAALLGIDDAEVSAQPVEIAQALATQIDATVVLKGPETVIANPEGRVWLHTRGCAGLGTSGSGDVLAGVVCGLMAQGIPPDQAAVWGVVLHGRAGEVLSREVGTTGFLAREIAGRIPAIRDALSARRA